MKPGTRLKSAACDTEVMVIRCGTGTIECGGAPMAEAKPAEPSPLSADFSGGTLMGKRYVDAAAAFRTALRQARQGFAGGRWHGADHQGRQAPAGFGLTPAYAP